MRTLPNAVACWRTDWNEYRILNLSCLYASEAIWTLLPPPCAVLSCRRSAKNFRTSSTQSDSIENGSGMIPSSQIGYRAALDTPYAPNRRRRRKSVSKFLTLPDRIHELCNQHGSLRALARVVGVDAGYLSRLYHGQKTEPGSALLRRLGLRKVVTYVLTKEPDHA